MKVSTRTRYGLRALIDIGVYYEGKFVLVKDIAKRQNLSERYLEHIMLQLIKLLLLNNLPSPLTRWVKPEYQHFSHFLTNSYYWGIL